MKVVRIVCLVVYYLPKKSGDFGWKLNGKPIFSSRTEISTGKRDFLKGSPKFPTGISEPKMCVPFAIFTSSKPYSNFDACHVLFSRGCANGTRQS